jgi:hypothetical protein
LAFDENSFDFTWSNGVNRAYPLFPVWGWAYFKKLGRRGETMSSIKEMNMRKSHIFGPFLVVAAALALSFLISPPARAQVAGATLTGTVTDPQGGAVPNAKVSARNVATGVTTDTTTNAAGAYNIVNLVPGDYEVDVSAPGFSTIATKVTLTVGATQALNPSLTVGQEIARQ